MGRVGAREGGRISSVLLTTSDKLRMWNFKVNRKREEQGDPANSETHKQLS